MGRRMIDRPELIEASDRDLERIARTGSINREPRWEAPVAMLTSDDIAFTSAVRIGNRPFPDTTTSRILLAP